MASAWSPDKKHSDRERWICIYPAYINSKKTLAEGRRIPKDKAVENPTHQEIRDVLSAAGMKVGVENKLYSRERSKELLYRGRIRVQLKSDDGKPINPDFPSLINFGTLEGYFLLDILQLQGILKIEATRLSKTLYTCITWCHIPADSGNTYCCDSVMLYLGQMIPKLKSRAGKQGSSDQGQSQSGSGALKKKSKGRR